MPQERTDFQPELIGFVHALRYRAGLARQRPPRTRAQNGYTSSPTIWMLKLPRWKLCQGARLLPSSLGRWDCRSVSHNALNLAVAAGWGRALKWAPEQGAFPRRCSTALST